MGIVSDLLQPQVMARNAFSDYWYQPVDTAAVSGVPVTADTALKVSTVWSCVRLISESLASLPLILYRRTADGERERATLHPLYAILHDQPNAQQTALEFIETLTVHSLLRGNGYAAILTGPRGTVEELIPLSPDRVTVERIRTGQRGPNGLEVVGKRYRYRQLDGSEVVLNGEDVFHLRGLSLDGITGVSPISYARESIGLAMATEEYGARFFGSGSQPRGILTIQGKLSKESTERLKTEWQSLRAGLQNAHKVAVLEEGMTWQQIGIAPEDSQFLESRTFQVADIARWFRVPLHMIGETAKSTSWGSGIEQLSLGFIMYTLLPWMRRWESTVRRDLITQTGALFAEFLVDALLRGDIESRYRAYATGRQWGWLSVNDVRRLENMPRLGWVGDIRLQPLNMVPLGTTPAEPSEPPDLPEPSEPPSRLPEMPEPSEPQEARQLDAGHYTLLVHDAAARILRKEIAALSKAARRCAGDTAAWANAVADFYADHAEHVAGALRIRRDAAEQYVAEQRQMLVEQGAGVMEDWESCRVADLVNLALEEHDANANAAQ